MIRIHNISLTAIIAALAAALLLLAACGGDDDDSPGGDDNGSGSPSASADAGESPDATDEPGPDETPGGSPGLPAVCTTEDQQRGLLSELTFNTEGGIFESGDDVEMTLTLINCAENDAVLTFPTTQRYIATVETEPAGVEVWNSSDGKSFADTLGEESIPAGETLVYTETWDQTDSDGEQVEDGRYKVSMLSVGCGTPEATDCRFGPIKYIDIGDVETDEAAETETPEAS